MNYFLYYILIENALRKIIIIIFTIKKMFKNNYIMIIIAS